MGHSVFASVLYRVIQMCYYDYNLPANQRPFCAIGCDVLLIQGRTICPADQPLTEKEQLQLLDPVDDYQNLLPRCAVVELCSRGNLLMHALLLAPPC